MSRAPQGREIVDVAACIVRSPDGRVLMAERTAGQISPGFWELPGGKVDPGETPRAARTCESKRFPLKVTSADEADRRCLTKERTAGSPVGS